MKLIGITQRFYQNSEYFEERDCLDQKWMKFFQHLDYLPIIIPNNLSIFELLLNKIKLDGFVITGGNNLVEYGGDCPTRDKVEKCIIEHSISEKIPVIGICRGMQLIQSYFGCSLKVIDGHVNKSHDIIQSDKSVDHPSIVNSYHTLGSYDTVDCLKILSKSTDGIIESIKHDKYEIYGIMWHPERGKNFNLLDLNFFKRIFK